MLACQQTTRTRLDPITQEVDVELERNAILETLNGETSAAFQRDYEAWKQKWVHRPDVTKTYLDFYRQYLL